MELEAEAVSYVVCSYLGIKNELSALYISQWQNDKAGLKQCGARVIKTAEKIIKAIDNNELSKGLPL